MPSEIYYGTLIVHSDAAGQLYVRPLDVPSVEDIVLVVLTRTERIIRLVVLRGANQ